MPLFMSPRPSPCPAAPCALPCPLALLLVGGGLSLALAAAPARAGVLYIITTKCSLNGAAAVPCKVEALNEDGATLYRHSIGSTTQTLRISDQPSRMSLDSGKGFQPLRNAAVLFSANTICVNDKELCAVNPNYLNSLLQQRPDFRGRDLVRAHFGSDGRVDLTCYDKGCELIGKALEAR